jgi:hypothetical protein
MPSNAAKTIRRRFPGSIGIAVVAPGGALSETEMFTMGRSAQSVIAQWGFERKYGTKWLAIYRPSRRRRGYRFVG